MTLKRLVRTAALSLLIGSTAVVWAQDDHNDAKPPEPRPEATKPQDEAKPRQDEEKRQREDEAKPQKQDEKERQQEDKNKQEGRAEQEHRGQQHPAGRRIPDDKFHSHFGREHTFVVNRVTVIEGRPRFQYSGYAFALVDPWPVGWAYTDNCYIDFIDGEYFLFDMLHPGVRVAVFVAD